MPVSGFCFGKCGAVVPSASPRPRSWRGVGWPAMGTRSVANRDPRVKVLPRGVGEVRGCFFLNYEQLRLVHPKPKLTTVIALLTISLDTSSAPHASQPCRTTWTVLDDTNHSFILHSLLKICWTLPWRRRRENANLNDWFKAQTRSSWMSNVQVCVNNFLAGSNLTFVHFSHSSSSPCKGCVKITTVFSHAQTVVLCPGCNMVLCQPTGGLARVTTGKQIDPSTFNINPQTIDPSNHNLYFLLLSLSGCSFRKKQH